MLCAATNSQNSLHICCETVFLAYYIESLDTPFMGHEFNGNTCAYFFQV